METATRKRNARTAAKQVLDGVKAKANKPSAKRVIAANVAECITYGVGAAAVIVVGDVLYAALSISVGAFIAIAITFALYCMALYATLWAGSAINTAVRDGVFDRAWERANDMYTETKLAAVSMWRRHA